MPNELAQDVLAMNVYFKVRTH